MATTILFSSQGEEIYACAGGPNYELLVDEIWPWVDIMLYSCLPFLIISVLNIHIIRQVSFPMGCCRNVFFSELENLIPSGHQRQLDHAVNSGILHNIYVSFVLASPHKSRSPSFQVVLAHRSRHEMAATRGSAVGAGFERRRPSHEGSTRLTIMLLAISFAFLLTTLPLTIVNIGRPNGTVTLSAKTILSLWLI